MEFDVARILPSEAIAEIHKPNSQLVTLTLEGYNLTAEAKSNPIEAASFDYEFPDERAAVFVAKHGEQIVGSVTLIKWPDDPNDERGGRFWPKLREIHPQMAQRAMDSNPLACDVGGIVVLPQFRGQHLGQLLLETAVQQVNPSILVGNTKTVEAVALRRKLVDQGYRTFFANTEVTPGHEQAATNDHQAILQAYMYAKKYEYSLLEGNVFLYYGGLAPDVPNTDGFPEIIQEAFKPVITQQRLRSSDVVMGPLLAIRKEILETA